MSFLNRTFNTWVHYELTNVQVNVLQEITYNNVDIHYLITFNSCDICHILKKNNDSPLYYPG